MTFKQRAIAWREDMLSRHCFYMAQAHALWRSEEWDTSRDPIAEHLEDERQWRREIEALRQLPDDTDHVTVRRAIQKTSPKSYSDKWVLEGRS